MELRDFKAELRKLSVDDLRSKAAERDIEGRSEMDKGELVDALAKDYQQLPPPEPRI